MPASIVLLAALANQALNRVRLESSAKKLRFAPRFIRELICAPFIVFGHSHEPESIALEGGGVYFNTGTWASDDDRFAFTHLLVTRSEDVTHAELRQWKGGASTPYRR